MEPTPNSTRPDPLQCGLVLPAYRQFCRDNGITILNSDVELQAEAVELFNQLKPHYSEFRGQIIHFHMWSVAGDIERTAQPIEEFLAIAAIVEARCQNLERWFAIAADTLVLCIGIILMLFVDRLTNGALPGWLVPVVVVLIGRYTWKWFFVTRPMLKWIRAKANLQLKLERLRQKLVAKLLATQIEPGGMAPVGARSGGTHSGPGSR